MAEQYNLETFIDYLIELLRAEYAKGDEYAYDHAAQTHSASDASSSSVTMSAATTSARWPGRAVREAETMDIRDRRLHRSKAKAAQH